MRIFTLCLIALVLATSAAGLALAAPPGVDRSTPRQTVAGFLRAVDSGDLAAAKQYLDRSHRPPEGMSWPELSERLEISLRQEVLLDLDAISDAPAGDPADGEDIERIGVIEDGEGGVPLTLERVQHGEREIWLFSSRTLHRLPEIGAPPESASMLISLVPERLRGQELLGLRPWQWLGLAGAVFLGLPLGYLLGRISTGFAARVAARTTPTWDDLIVAKTRGGVHFAFAWLSLAIVIQSLALPVATRQWLDIIARTPLIICVAWLLRQVVGAVTEIYLEQTLDDQGLNRRGLRTQISILRRLSSVTIAIIAGSLVLMQFELMRNVGLSVLASAGVAGVALGFAAKESLANVIAGLQLSVTQTIRLGDSVHIEGEWAKVEEIALTYVRLQLNDDRRLIVPVSHLLSNSFENWSAGGDGLIGLVEFSADPGVPVAEVRRALERIAAAHENHDGRECRLQVIDLDERRALLRARVSSGDLSRTFQMRCDLRESLLDFLQQLEGGRYLTHLRVEPIEARG